MKAALLVLAVIAVAWTGIPAHAQQTKLTIAGFPIAFPSPSPSDFTAGVITSSNPVSFTVNALSGTTGQRTTSVWIRCAAPCPAQGSKSAAQLRWRRADLGVWNTITTSDALIESRVVQRFGVNDPWSNSLFFQFLLDWLNDTPSAVPNQYNIILTLTITVP